MENGIGHNSAELEWVIQEAREGFSKVEESFDKAEEGWLQYGAALNEARKMFPSNEQFGEWVRSCQLDTNDRHDRAAAMWAAANLEDFKATKKANPRVRTVRGLHAKWKQEQKEPKKSEGKPPKNGNSPSKPQENENDEGDDDVVDNSDTTPETTWSISDAEKAILQFNSLSDEEKIKQLGGRPGVIDQKELDEKLESDFKPLNSASAILVSLNRLRIYGGKKGIKQNIMQVLSQSSRMKPYEAEALVLLGEIILEKRDELESMYSNKTDLNKLN